MKEAFEKIIERLEVGAKECLRQNQIATSMDKSKTYGVMAEVYARAIEIVSRVAEEYVTDINVGNNDGWIPCSERLPEEYDSIFARLKGTKKWNNAMFEKTSDSVNVTVTDNKGQSVTTHAHTVDGEWHCDLLIANKEYYIIAWKPLPEPYKGDKHE